MNYCTIKLFLLVFVTLAAQSSTGTAFSHLFSVHAATFYKVGISNAANKNKTILIQGWLIVFFNSRFPKHAGLKQCKRSTHLFHCTALCGLVQTVYGIPGSDGAANKKQKLKAIFWGNVHKRESWHSGWSSAKCDTQRTSHLGSALWRRTLNACVN